MSAGDETLVPETNRENVWCSQPIMPAVEYGRSLSTTTAEETLEINVQPPKSRKSCEDMLIKQGRQIQTLYELHKETLEKVRWIQNQIKLQNEKKKKIDLSEKIFNLIDKENHLDSDDVINEETYNFEVSRQDTHPVDNPLAK
ncbi:hypothetical protein RclHR1_17280004 [Rhizophagus clarus]|uniref:Uncharacterized protein n=1 Tax=Rhizophagus clarus TaxID=94130 RepID=A0A2Z6RCC4_9GLOM|nr:hypothetical protein RclHR1_17280004 [Rhizophagus clarus]